jgi:hypothetical protein
LLAAAGGIYQYDRVNGGLLPGPAVSEKQAAAPRQTVSAAPIVQPPAAPPAPAEPPAAAPAAADAAPENRIIGLQIRETETEMRLEFALRERAVVYLKERSQNSFVYHVRGIGSEIEAPLIRGNRWIRRLAIEPYESGIDIRFATAADMLVETRQQLTDGRPMWVIYLRQAMPAPAAAAAPVQKPPAKETVAAAAPAPAPPAPVKLDIKSTNPASAAADKLEYAVELMNSGRPADAEQLLLGMLDGRVDYDARRHLIALYERLGRPARLRTLLLASLQKYPRDTLFTTEYARLLFQAGGFREVIALLDANESLDASQHAVLAASYQRLDRHADAIRHYRMALRQDAGNARNWVGLGISQEQSAAFADALESYREAARLGGLNGRLQAFVDRRSDKLRQVVD